MHASWQVRNSLGGAKSLGLIRERDSPANPLLLSGCGQTMVKLRLPTCGTAV
jgi:hypothetical protein